MASRMIIGWKGCLEHLAYDHRTGLTLLLPIICDRSLLFRCFISECCPACPIHLFGAPQTHCALDQSSMHDFDPRERARFLGFPWRDDRAITTARFASSKHCSENAIPKLCSHAVVSVRKSVMDQVMFQQGSRENCWILMGAIVDI